MQTPTRLLSLPWEPAQEFLVRGAALDGNEIAARLHNFKGAKTECPQCDKAQWATPPENGRFFLLVAYLEQREAEEIPLIPLICANCGFVRFHDEEKLHD